jgi:hypothetical protein
VRIGLAIQEAHAAELDLADALLRTGERHSAEHDVRISRARCTPGVTPTSAASPGRASASA